MFTLYLNEDVNEDGTLKPTAWETTVPHAREAEGGDDVIALDGHAEAFDEKKALDEAKRSLSQDELDTTGEGGMTTSANDVD